MAATRHASRQPCPPHAPAMTSRSVAPNPATPSRSKPKKGATLYGPPWPKKIAKTKSCVLKTRHRSPAGLLVVAFFFSRGVWHARLRATKSFIKGRLANVYFRRIVASRISATAWPSEIWTPAPDPFGRCGAGRTPRPHSSTDRT